MLLRWARKVSRSSSCNAIVDGTIKLSDVAEVLLMSAPSTSQHRPRCFHCADRLAEQDPVARDVEALVEAHVSAVETVAAQRLAFGELLADPPERARLDQLDRLLVLLVELLVQTHRTAFSHRHPPHTPPRPKNEGSGSLSAHFPAYFSGCGAVWLARLPIAHLPSAVLPGATVTLTIATDALRLAITAATELNDSRLLLTGGDEDELAVVARVPNVGNLPTGESAAIVRVEGRARITSTQVEAGAATFAEAELLIDGPSSASTTAATHELRATLELIAEKRNSRRLPELLRTTQEPGALADAVALWAEFSDDNRLVVLRATDVADRVDAIHSWARNHLNELQVAETIRNDVSEGMDKQQREYLLRQQMASIRKELGEGDEDVTDEYRAKLADLDAPESVKIAIDKELDRFERMSSQSPEHSWIRTWLDRIFEMPWGERSDDNIDLNDAQTVLDDDHYGLDDVKDRIVEFLATRKLRHERGLDARIDAGGERTVRGHGTAITLIGPPGVGKTSLGESIARAMGREFLRVALGGVRDESEIRGHRRTYVGSQPGRIVRALQEAKTMNPVILLDEVDKLAAGGWSGDTTAALLEVLDPAQNHTFRDHYLEIDLDLSEVVFIATANVADTIPGPAARQDGPRPPRWLHGGRKDLHRPPLSAAPADRTSRTAARRGHGRRCGHQLNHLRMDARGRRPITRTRVGPIGPQGHVEGRNRFIHTDHDRLRRPVRVDRSAQGRRRSDGSDRHSRGGHRTCRHRRWR